MNYLPNDILELRRTSFIPMTVLLIALSTVTGCANHKEGSIQDVDGKYRIIKAYALLHDQGALREIQTREMGVVIIISENAVTAGEEKHQINKREKITGDDFNIYHAGMNYSGVGKEIFGKMPEDARITVLHLGLFSATGLVGSNIFCANGRLLVDAVREFAGQKSWASDMFFYLAERM
jgi:hypothetical protein